MKPLALIIEHEICTTLGTVEEWLLKENYDIHFLKFYKGDTEKNLIYQIDEYQMIFILGGTMNVDECHLHPWLKKEKDFIKKIILNDNKIIGLCLGAQLLSDALGGKVQNANEWEVGWQEIEFMNREKLTVFQWHGQAFIPPADAKTFAKSHSCSHQYVSFKKNIIGFQFHPEVNEEWIRSSLDTDNYPRPGPYVQSPEDILKNMHHMNKLKSWFFGILSSFKEN